MVPCQGNKNETCGGKNAISLYVNRCSSSSSSSSSVHVVSRLGGAHDHMLTHTTVSSGGGPFSDPRAAFTEFIIGMVWVRGGSGGGSDEAAAVLGA